MNLRNEAQKQGDAKASQRGLLYVKTNNKV